MSARVRATSGLREPPADAVALLLAHQLTLPDDSLEVVLRSLGVRSEAIQKLDAMLDPGAGCVYVRADMHDRQKNWGYMHELGHHVIPWHRDLLYHCPILRLPPALQRQFEREADEFASDMFFFGEQFIEEALSLPFGLQAPLQLATERFDVSLHAAFWRYAEEHPEPCCLLVSKPNLDGACMESSLELRYYVPSRGMRIHLPPGQVNPPSSTLGRLYNSGMLQNCVEHELTIGSDHHARTYQASSMSNGYLVFTLIRPQER